MFATISSVLSTCGKIFFSGKETGWKNRACFGFLCLLLGLTISGGLILTLFLSKVGVGQVTLILSFSVGILISVLAYFFRSARCMSVLFLLACAMKEGRNVLIATGTSIVVFNNVRNILENLTVVASSLICNMEAKRDFLKGLTQFYTDLIKSVYLFAKVHFYNPFKDVVSVSDDFQFQNTIDDDKMKTFLNETQLQIQTVSTNLSSLFKFGTSVGHIAFLVLGISIISVGSGFFLRKFLKKIKANNLYITKAFLEYDEGQRKRHLRCVLPLSKKEKSQYIQIPSLKTSREQRMKMALFFLPILTNILIWGVILFLDFMLYWLILVIGKNLQSLDPVEVPITMSFSVSIT